MTDTNTAQMVADLRATDDAVRAQGWVAPGLGVPGAPLGLLGATGNPLTGLAAAGLGWFMPLVSFLGEGLTQLQGGNGASVSSGAHDFGDAGQDLAGVAGSYRRSASAQTSGWSGTAASEYRQAATQHAEGIAGLGEASNTVGSAIIGAGQVVAQAIAEITELIAEAVAQIVPIMTQAVARAGETFGQSVVEAIPPCVGIAVQYALRIAAKLAALVASGDNLLKLVQGALGVVDLIKTALSGISGQSVQGSADPQAGAGGGAGQPGADPASTMAAVEAMNENLGANDAGGTGSSGAATPSGGFGGPATSGGAPALDGGYSPGASADLPGLDTRASGAVPPVLPANVTVPDTSRLPGVTGISAGSGVSGFSGVSAPGGGVVIGGAALPPGAGVAGRGGDTVRQEPRQQQTARTPKGGTGMPGGAMPMGAAGGARSGEDKEHQRKYTVVEHHAETFTVAPAVIDSDR